MLTHNQKQLIYWIKERNLILTRREALCLPPWTENKVMQEVYFCNVNREDDKVTKWIRQRWTYDVDPEAYDLAMITARIFNLPSTLDVIGQPKGNLEDWLWLIEDTLQGIKEAGQQIWNGAYIISTNGKKIDKLSYCLYLLERIVQNPKITDNCKTLKEAHTELMKVEGLASFLAAQVVADLKNSPGHPLQDAPDWFSFSAPGPGSLRGLEWFWEEKVTKKNYEQKINDAFELLEFELPDNILSILCMQNLQNCFCEYDKFMRVTNGTGRSKRKYNGMGE